MRKVSAFLNEVASLLSDENVVIFPLERDEYVLPDYQGIQFFEQVTRVLVNNSLVSNNLTKVSEFINSPNKWQVISFLEKNPSCSTKITNFVNGKYLIKKSDLSIGLIGITTGKVSRFLNSESSLTTKPTVSLLNSYNISNKVDNSLLGNYPYKVTNLMESLNNSLIKVNNSCTNNYQTERDSVRNFIEGVNSVRVTETLVGEASSTVIIKEFTEAKYDVSNIVSVFLEGRSSAFVTNKINNFSAYTSLVNRFLENKYDLKKNLIANLEGAYNSAVSNNLEGITNSTLSISNSIIGRYQIIENVTSSVIGKSTSSIKNEFEGISNSTVLVSSSIEDESLHVNLVRTDLYSLETSLDIVKVSGKLIGFYSLNPDSSLPDQNAVSVVLS